MVGVVYGIFFHKPRGVYVGCSLDYFRRWRRHLVELRRRRHSCVKLQAAFDAQGEWSMRFVVLGWYPGVSDDQLLDHELAWARRYADCLLNGQLDQVRSRRELGWDVVAA